MSDDEERYGSDDGGEVDLAQNFSRKLRLLKLPFPHTILSASVQYWKAELISTVSLQEEAVISDEEESGDEVDDLGQPRESKRPRKTNMFVDAEAEVSDEEEVSISIQTKKSPQPTEGPFLE